MIVDGINEARYVLGKMMFEGTSDKITKNYSKGTTLVKEAIQHGSIEALEYMQYLDIRFSPQPDIVGIQSNLKKVIEYNKSTRSLNTLAEFEHALASNAKAQITGENADPTKYD